MDSFRAALDAAVRTDDEKDWSPHTLDYALFKERLKFFARRRSRIRTMIKQSPDNRIPEDVLEAVINMQPSPPFRTRRFNPEDQPIVNEYQECLDREGSNSSETFHTQATKRKSKRSILRRLANLERAELVAFLQWEMDKVQMFYISQWQRLSDKVDEEVIVDNSTGDELLELKAFCVINIVIVRQVLIRFDGYARTFEGTPLLDYYMKEIVTQPTSFRKILQHKELVAIADSWSQRIPQEDPYRIVFDAQRKMLQEIIGSSEAKDGITRKDAFIYKFKEWMLVGAFEDRLGLEPAYLTMRGQSLAPEMTHLAEWRANRRAASDDTKSKGLSEMQVFHLTLNLLSAFLYCMNYYIVEPSSTMYCNRLGAHDALSGTLIGMMPLAAFLSSLPFSMWTNQSFRHPFIMSCLLLVMGNFLYSFADQFQVVEIALAGRFIAGLGAPKCIIRRYMADTTPMSIRTSVNALFGMVVAAGSAMGPAMAIMLNSFELTVAIPHLGIFTLNGLTLPGYFMAALWTTFFVIVVLTFEEPDREGLKEQQELESKRVVAGRDRSQSFTDSSEHGDTTEIYTIFTDESGYDNNMQRSFESSGTAQGSGWITSLPIALRRHVVRANHFLSLITVPVRICLGLLFAKVFTIEALASATSALSKNRYGWQVKQVGLLGLTNGLLVIPFSLGVGRLAMSFQDHVLMKWLVSVGCLGLFLLIDISDLMDTPTSTYNEGDLLAVGPKRYITGYFLAYLSIQSFEGIIGSTLSKVIPTALASGTINSGLLATMVDTLGRACGDMFISMVGFINLRQLINLLFIPGFTIMMICLLVIIRYRDLLSV